MILQAQINEHMYAVMRECGVVVNIEQDIGMQFIHKESFMDNPYTPRLSRLSRITSVERTYSRPTYGSRTTGEYLPQPYQK